MFECIYILIDFKSNSPKVTELFPEEVISCHTNVKKGVSDMYIWTYAYNCTCIYIFIDLI